MSTQSNDPNFWNHLRELLAAGDWKSAQAALQEENDRLEQLDEIKNYVDINIGLQFAGKLAEYEGEIDHAMVALDDRARGAYERTAPLAAKREASPAELAADKAGKLAVALSDDLADRPCTVCAEGGQAGCPAHALLDAPIPLRPTGKAIEMVAEPAGEGEKTIATSDDDFAASAFNGATVEQSSIMAPVAEAMVAAVKPGAPLWGCDHQAAAPEKCARGCNG